MQWIREEDFSRGRKATASDFERTQGLTPCDGIVVYGGISIQDFESSASKSEELRVITVPD